MLLKGFLRWKRNVRRDDKTLVDQVISGFLNTGSLSSDRIQDLLDSKQVKLSIKEQADLLDILIARGNDDTFIRAKKKYDEDEAKRWESSKERLQRQELWAMRELPPEKLLGEIRKGEISLVALEIELLSKLSRDKSLGLTWDEEGKILELRDKLLRKERKRDKKQKRKLQKQEIELLEPITLF